METHCQNPPLSLITDLKVRRQRPSRIIPPEKTERRFLFLSNMDQVLNFNVETVHFFPANPSFPPETVVDILEAAFQKILMPYDFLAGRLRFNPQQRRLEIDCNSAGIGFWVASSELSLDEIGDLVYPNPAFRQLIMDKVDTLDADDSPLCVVQVTSFKCGGFAMGLCTNHVAFDGISVKLFLENLASLTDNKPLVLTPCNDRQLVAARSPPRVTCSHPELVKLEIPQGNVDEFDQSNTPVFAPAPEDLDFKIFRLTESDISNLKQKAAKLGVGEGRISSSFNVVTAHVWRCKALAAAADITQNDISEKMSTVLYAVDVRSKLTPPLPPSYTGNAVLTAYAMASCHELDNAPFSSLVEKVFEGATRMTDEYIRSAIDWGELYQGYPLCDLLISSWWKLGFSEVKYPWGRPKYCSPIIHHKKDVILFFPDIERGQNALNIFVALPHKEMDKFQALFNKFLA